MSMDPSLRSHGGLAGQRSVMTRPERIARMIEEGEFDPEQDSPLGLPKTRVRTSKAGSKPKKTAEEVAEEASAEGEAVAESAGE